MTQLVSGIASQISSLLRRPDVRDAMRVMSERDYMFGSKTAMQLTSISLSPAARESLDNYMDDRWNTDPIPSYLSGITPEVVIGGGIHAAIYCAARRAKGAPAPLVIERNRPGGIFAVSRRPTFYLNSLNQPGKLGLPGDTQTALNYIPGAPIQPSFVSGREFQTNADLAFVARLTLALTANVRLGEVERVEYDRFGFSSEQFTVRLVNGAVISTGRVIDARGLGDPKNDADADGERVQTYPQYLASLDTVCPLRGLDRVAIIGGGNAALTAAESLLGIGPDNMMSVTALDYVRLIDIYAEDLPTEVNGWRDRMRGRYQRLATYLPGNGYTDRLRIINRRGIASKALDSVLVNGQSYDRVIYCTGFTQKDIRADGFNDLPTGYPDNNEALARKYDGEYFAIGPAARLEYSRNERLNQSNYTNITDNVVSLFRLANRTSALGIKLT